MKKVAAIFVTLLLVLSIFIPVFAIEEDTAQKDIVTIVYMEGIGTTVDLNAVEEKGYLYDLFYRIDD